MLNIQLSVWVPGTNGTNLSVMNVRLVRMLVPETDYVFGTCVRILVPGTDYVWPRGCA